MKLLSPLKAIRKNCRDCMNGSHDQIKRWRLTCPLWPYRFGKRPRTAGITEKEIKDYTGAE